MKLNLQPFKISKTKTLLSINTLNLLSLVKVS